MAFPINLIFSGASFLLDRLPGIFASFGAGAAVPPEAIDGAKLLISLGPKAIELVEDLGKPGITPEVVAARWADAKAAVEAGNAAWEAAAPK